MKYTPLVKEGSDTLIEGILTSFTSQQLLKQLLGYLHTHQNLQLSEVIALYQDAKNEALIPLSIFSHSLAPMEALTKFLKENEQMSLPEIALLLHRDQRSIWANYRRAGRILKSKLASTSETYVLPLSLFQDRSFSILESVVLYLNSVHHLTPKQMGKLLHKSPNSMAVLLKRGKEKKNG
ncbi:TPA: hypothetical protein HA242_00035 [Candidatus Woesearchaeota archaeon]|nr:hypothetical protein [Candidatus Woesearchaeota archaeon]HIH12094.1 hypothetical protein [Candidatus Woesearchaeota archaeon]